MHAGHPVRRGSFFSLPRERSECGEGGRPKAGRVGVLQRIPCIGWSPSQNPSSSRTAIDGYRYAQPLLRAIISDERIITLNIKRMTPMLDKPAKTYELIDLLEAAVPFEVALMPDLIEHLARQQNPIAVNSIETVSKVSYLGDPGGIMCHIRPKDAENALVISLTHVRVRRSLPFAAAVLDYQKHRTKKLKKQTGM
jgi:hypothetical protein